MFPPARPPLQHRDTTTEPNLEMLRSMGWIIAWVYGNYCVAWRNQDEVVFEWRDNFWHRIAGRTKTVG
jgi:hypothetical protein